MGKRGNNQSSGQEGTEGNIADFHGDFFLFVAQGVGDM
jgi:hypothetical protein